MSRRDRDATRIACPADGAQLQRERRGEDPALTCPRCSETWAPGRWAELAALVGGAR